MIVILCGKCWQGFRCQGEVPHVCPMCHEVTTWTTPPIHPKGWALTYNDLRLLHSLKIDPEVEPSAV